MFESTSSESLISQFAPVRNRPLQVPETDPTQCKVENYLRSLHEPLDIDPHVSNHQQTLFKDRDLKQTGPQCIRSEPIKTKDDRDGGDGGTQGKHQPTLFKTRSKNKKLKKQIKNRISLKTIHDSVEKRGLFKRGKFSGVIAMVDGHLRNYDKIQDKAYGKLRTDGTDVEEHPKSGHKPENSTDADKFQKYCEEAHLTHQWVKNLVDFEIDCKNSSYYSKPSWATAADPAIGTDFMTENRCNR